MRLKLSFAFLALFLGFTSFAQVVRYASMSEFSGWPRVVLFDDDSERSREIYQSMDELASKARGVSFMVIQYDTMRDQDKQRAETMWVEGPASIYVAWDYLDEGFALRHDFDLTYLKPLVKDLEKMDEAVRLYRDQEYRSARKKFVKIFESENVFIPEAGLYAGWCYANEGQYDAAANFFIEASRYGVAEALYQAGYFYECGLTSAGIQMEMALMYYHKAARLGHENAIKRLSALE